MFGRLNQVQLRAAEEAIRSGRIDEAYAALVSPGLSGHRKAERMLAELFEPLMDRAQELMMSGRFQDAMVSLNMADRCNVDAALVAEWRGRAVKAMERRKDRNADEQRAAGLARQALDGGELTLAGEHLGRLEPHLAERRRMENELESRAQRAARLATEARAALKADQLELAVTRFVAARRDHAANEDAIALGAELLKRIGAAVRAAVSNGRLDESRHLFALLTRVDANHPETTELQRGARWIDEARRSMSARRYGDAVTALGKLSRLIGGGKWIKEVCHHLEQMAAHDAALSQSPLGLSDSGHGTSLSGDETLAAPQRRQLDTPAEPPRVVQVAAEVRDLKQPQAAAVHAAPPIIANDMTSRRLLLAIDGVGSFLLLRHGRATIGRMGTLADLPIRSDLPERAAEIIHNGDDYFLLAERGVELAGQPVSRALLSHGDRVHLGRRVRLTFERPTRKSQAATLTLGEGVRSVLDVRRALLWTGPILIGNSTDCHVGVRGSDDTFVLIDRGGSIEARMLPGAGRQIKPVSLEIGRSTMVGDLRLSIQPVPVTSSTGMIKG